jgi:hypothetical protein
MLGVAAVCSSPTAKAWYPSPLLVIADHAGCQRRFCCSTAAAPATPAAPPARRPTGTPPTWPPPSPPCAAPVPGKSPWSVPPPGAPSLSDPRRRRYQGPASRSPPLSSISNSATGSPRRLPSPGHEHRCSSPTPPMTATAPLPRCKPCSAEPDPASSYSSDYPRRRPRLGHRQRPQRPSSPLSVLRPPHHLPRPPPEISSGHHQTSQRRNGQPGSAWRLLRNVLTSLAISSGYSPLMAWEASG